MENIKNMTPKLIGETWRKYPTETSTQKATYGLFECQYCKKEFECQVSDVKNGSTKSCGCLIGRAGTHLFYKHRFYTTWRNILARCLNTSHRAYVGYGGRGITVCEEWLDVTNFVAWCEATHPNIEGLSLDRIDNDKGYSPDNCRWADASTQNINQRMQKNNTSGYVGVTYYKKNNKWVVNIRHHKVLKYVGGFKTIEEAILARDNYIIENNLPHKLSTEY